MRPLACATLLALQLGTAGGMAYLEHPNGWDSWLVHERGGPFRLFYMAGPRNKSADSPWNHVAAAISADGAHWAGQGFLYDTPPECCPPSNPGCQSMGSGNTWAVLDNSSSTTTTYVTFFSALKLGDKAASLFAATSTDLVSWEHRPEYRFAVDGKDYADMDGEPHWSPPTNKRPLAL